MISWLFIRCCVRSLICQKRIRILHFRLEQSVYSAAAAQLNTTTAGWSDVCPIIRGVCACVWVRACVCACAWSSNFVLYYIRDYADYIFDSFHEEKQEENANIYISIKYYWTQDYVLILNTSTYVKHVEWCNLFDTVITKTASLPEWNKDHSIAWAGLNSNLVFSTLFLSSRPYFIPFLSPVIRKYENPLAKAWVR